MEMSSEISLNLDNSLNYLHFTSNSGTLAIMNNPIDTENLKLLFGIKIKSYRTDQGFSLQALSKKSGLAVSYLSEIESGKKYPKPEKMIALAKALNVDYDALVSIRSDKKLDPFAALINSELLRQFPFHLFGITSADIVGLFKNNAAHANDFLQTFLQISRVYDLSLENFLFAALRTYLRQHKNYFPDLEKKAAAFADRHGMSRKKLTYCRLKALLEKEYNYLIDETALADHPELKGFRSVFQGEGRLAINSRLMDMQKAFIIARELGFAELKIQKRPASSSWIKVQSFEELVNNFKASYFGGALLLDQHRLAQDIKKIFNQEKWDKDNFSNLLEKYQVTPEMLLYRFSQILPGLLGIDRIFYFRFVHTPDLYSAMLTKELNMTQTLHIYGLGLNEHYCRRMIPMQFLKLLQQGNTHILSGVQIIRYTESQDRFLLLSMARPLALSEKRGSAIAIGIKLDLKSEPFIRFIKDNQIPFAEVSETCERCPLKDCSQRVVTAEIINHRLHLKKSEDALKNLKPDYPVKK